MKTTPILHAKGFYKLKAPWVAKPSIVYECLAIRSFDDIYKLGHDVYTRYYEPAGLVKPDFNFAKEVANKVNIITLKGSDGKILYVPDSYILSVPKSNSIDYSQVVLAVSLGALPDDVNIENVKSDIAAIVADTMGIKAKVNTCIVPLVLNPTYDEHVELERIRTKGVSFPVPDTQTKLNEAEKLIAELKTKVSVLETIIIDNGITDTL